MEPDNSDRYHKSQRKKYIIWLTKLSFILTGLNKCGKVYSMKYKYFTKGLCTFL
jgi:hypothetical protein